MTSLFDHLEEPTLPYQRHSATSREAAELAVPLSGKYRLKVLLHLQSRGEEGSTDEEMQLALEMNPSTQRPRRGELVTKGLVRDSGVRRKTRTGRAAVVWVVTTKEEAKS